MTKKKASAAQPTSCAAARSQPPSSTPTQQPNRAEGWVLISRVKKQKPNAISKKPLPRNPLPYGAKWKTYDWWKDATRPAGKSIAALPKQPEKDSEFCTESMDSLYETIKAMAPSKVSLSR